MDPLRSTERSGVKSTESDLVNDVSNLVDAAHPISTRVSRNIESLCESDAAQQDTLNGAELSVQSFADRVIVIVAQRGALLGTLVSARREELRDGGSTFAVETLLGADRGGESSAPSASLAWAELVARQVIQHMTADGCSKELLFCCDLSRKLRTHFAAKVVLHTLKDMNAW
eukprot:CAMPEP_0185829740 /NCGR_PEP_ID=MMETSP1353-20130828/425_1 /TAXON_ID=1077150 /ORGANISM="Erythrolobus australicus, Strain CCMP3124" /LENGTH=171 /DNA_ID=CAMNT_0028527561 /DNA_START=246 /DNA_END=758 /DNA_ORIENTATION=+